MTDQIPPPLRRLLAFLIVLGVALVVWWFTAVYWGLI